MDEIEKYECLVVNYFGLKKEDLYSHEKVRVKALARRMLWYFLHGKVGVSSQCLASRYKKTKRNIFIAISLFKEEIRLQKYYKDIYDNFCSYMEKQKEA